MKIFLLAVLVLSSFAISAKEVQSMKCTVQSYYLNFKNEIVVDFTNPVFQGALINNDSQWEIAWSQSECEDSTSMQFDLKEFKKFAAGNSELLSGRMKHDEPSIVFEADIDCRPL